MIHCDRASSLFGQAWDDELSVDEREGLEAHFAACPACQKSYDEFARTLELVQRLPRPQVADDFAERVLRTARGRELAASLARGRRPAVLQAFLAPGGRLALAAALVATVGVGAFVLSRPHGLAPQPKAAPTVAVVPASPAPAGEPAPAPTDPTRMQLGDPDGPVTALAAPRAPKPAAPHRAAPTRGTGELLAQQTIPDSLFDHSNDVDFVLDPVKVRRERGRGYTPVTSPVRGEAASITF